MNGYEKTALLERADLLHPYFQPIVREAVKRCYERGLYVFIMQGRRSAELQACLYAQGRLAAGSSFTYSGLLVTTRVEGDVVVARCGKESTRVAKSRWSRRVTNVLSSWHIEGLAVDLGFRSGPDAKDALNLDLDKRKAWGEIERVYAAIAGVWLEVSPDSRWGNDWDGDGIPVKLDPDEKLVDMPHFEWHPGRTLAQVKKGDFPPFPRQCPRCDNFRAAFVEQKDPRGGWIVNVCSDCAGRDRSVDPKCVGLK